MFSFLTEILIKNGKGIHAYRACAERGYEAAGEKPDAAAAFFLLARSAEMFVDMNERMPITSKDIDAAFAQFQSNVEALDSAWTNGSERETTKALNFVAHSLMTRGT